MDLNYITIKSVIEDWIDFTGETEQVKESVLLKIADDTVQKITKAENQDLRVARLDVKDHQAMLPKGFRSVVQVMYRDQTPQKVTREEVVEWTQKIWGTECELKINLECPECHKDTCDCNSDIAIVDVDRIWQDSHPEHYASKRYLHNFGRTSEQGSNPCYDFRLMKRTSNNYFAVPYHVTGCPNINFDCSAEYDITPPKMVTNFREGEVLLSYMSAVLDSDGYHMITDHPRVHEAIFYSIEERMLWKKMRMDPTGKYGNLYSEAVRKKNESLVLAKSAIGTPSYDKWVQFLQNHWKKFLPTTLDRDEQNLGRFEADRYQYPKY